MQNLEKQSSVVGAKYKPTDSESSTKPKQGGHKKQLMKNLKFFKGQNITNRQIDRKQLCLFVVVWAICLKYEKQTLSPQTCPINTAFKNECKLVTQQIMRKFFEAN